ncbi:hypothetical protein ANCDUO_12761 [Ancylostoma duodenale]|uniref:Uncharacterized protein n=1 Tax=Ancylostoma duodenale TaxID=51022 RepID=A0A0C2GIZ1_9BILA|nr:hypothetical protein ANCDUO_12761 [Ancylostoma duodenale]
MRARGFDNRVLTRGQKYCLQVFAIDNRFGWLVERSAQEGLFSQIKVEAVNSMSLIKGRGGRRGGGVNDSFGGTDNSTYYYYADRGGRGSRGRGGGGRSCETGGSFGGREHNYGNWRDGRNGGGDGWQGRRRSGGYTGFSTGSFGVMGDADSINRSDTQSPEALAAEVPLATADDLRYEARETVQSFERNSCSDFHKLNVRASVAL